nr:Uncharacterised protein [Ipomoea batatas]
MHFDRNPIVSCCNGCCVTGKSHRISHEKRQRPAGSWLCTTKRQAHLIGDQSCDEHRSTPEPSPMTKPSRFLSHGLEAFSGSSFLWDKARQAMKPPTPAGMTPASVPPATMIFASPLLIIVKAHSIKNLLAEICIIKGPLPSNQTVSPAVIETAIILSIYITLSGEVSYLSPEPNRTEARPIPVMTILFLGSVSRLGAETFGDAMALIPLHFGPENRKFLTPLFSSRQ